jgi:hypothetical protein
MPRRVLDQRTFPNPVAPRATVHFEYTDVRLRRYRQCVSWSRLCGDVPEDHPAVQILRAGFCWPPPTRGILRRWSAAADGRRRDQLRRREVAVFPIYAEP